MGMSYHLVIPKASPSVNVGYGEHWSKKFKVRREWQWLVRIARLEAKAFPEPLSRASITITRYGKRLLDHDNFVAGCKPIQDALRIERFITDDTLEVIGQPHYHQHIGKPHRTEITIEAR
jgi:hypothetical protein